MANSDSGDIAVAAAAAAAVSKSEDKEGIPAERKNAASKTLSTDTQFARGPPFWIVDGEPYDFRSFIHKHPGGAGWFLLSGHRDITCQVHTYHVNPAKKVLPLLAKYKITEGHELYDVAKRENLLPKMGAPPFLFAKDFDARTDIPAFDFHNPKHLLPALRKVVDTPEFQKKISSANFWFNVCAYVAMTVYGLNTAAFMFDKFYVPTWVSVALYILLKTSFGAFGHYFVHAKKPNPHPESLFDMPYIGSAIAADGHVALHHAHTHTGADVKTMFFSGIWILPPLYRTIGYTLHKFGLAMTGMIIRCLEISCVEFNLGIFPIMFWLTRFFITAEFYFAYQAGKIVPFFIAFVGTLWFNSFLVLSSHDFEEFYEDPDGGHHPDWGIFQLNNCHDMWITGSKYIDIFLSAGLSSHRSHHLFPYQPSGFANIVSEEPIRKILPDFGLEWHKPKCFWTERAPYVFKFCFMHPTIGMENMSFWLQHIHPMGIFNTIKFILTGFIGFNAV